MRARIRQQSITRCPAFAPVEARRTLRHDLAHAHLVRLRTPLQLPLHRTGLVVPFRPAGGNFLAVASAHWELVVTRLSGETIVTIHGPETRPREVYCPADGEWFAIRFKAGTFMPGLPVHRLIDGNDVNLAPAFRGRFRLDDSAWEIPDYGNAEVFVTAWCVAAC